jgi:hypothetical protein
VESFRRRSAYSIRKFSHRIYFIAASDDVTLALYYKYRPRLGGHEGLYIGRPAGTAAGDTAENLLDHWASYLLGL